MIVDHEESQKSKVILLLTDPGEEIDDETAIEYLINQCRKDTSLNLIVATVGGKMSSLRRFGIINALFNLICKLLKYSPLKSLKQII